MTASTARRRLIAAAAAGLILPEQAIRAQVPENSFDVIVAGSGLAGFSAAAAALEAGAKRVLILEKGPLIGGHSLYSSGSVAAVLPPAPGSAFTDSVELFVEDAMSVGRGRGNRAILTQIAGGSYDAVRWLKRCGVYFGMPFTAHSGRNPRSISMPGNSAGRAYILALSAYARRLGAQILMNRRVTEIARQVTGWLVCAQSPDGQTHMYRTRSLILATGGFTANIERRSAINPLLTADVRTSANPYGTLWDGAEGDGIDLGISAGAAATSGFGLQLLPFWGGRLLDYVGADIYVTMQGHRFVNEILPWNSIADKILRLPERLCWVITDSRSQKGATLGIKLINGIVHKSDSVEAMARGMHMDPAVLTKTLSDYNRAVRNGFDPLTGKNVFAQTIETPPFYWGQEQIYVHTTLDGLVTDASARVLNRNGEALPGLFAAGETVGGIFGEDRLGGASLTSCLVMGRLAGKEAAL